MKTSKRLPDHSDNGQDKPKKACLILEDGSDHRKEHYRFDTGTEITFASGSSLNYFRLCLHTNYPINNGKFDRSTYHAVPFRYYRSTGVFHVDSSPMNNLAKIQADIPGVYNFIVVEDIEAAIEFDIQEKITEKWEVPKQIKSLGCFVIDPNLRAIGGKSLLLDQLSLQTVISRCLGPLNEWADRLQVTYESGFNGVHFTPFQKYGHSKSCYSIYDHFSFDTSIADREINDQFLPLLMDLKTKFHCLIVDIVLNHTSNDCPIIKKHPESYYNLHNTPHLRPAFVVDRALHYVSEKIVRNDGNNFKMANVDDLKKIESLLRHDVLLEIRLIEFFIVDIEKTILNFTKYLTEGKFKSVTHENADVSIIQDPHYRRLGCLIDFDRVYNKFLRPEMDITPGLIDKVIPYFRDHLVYLNQSKYKLVAEIYDEIVNNVLGQIFYEFIDSRGPKRTTISYDHPLVASYFSICINNYNASSFEDDEDLIYSEKAKYIVAHPGWVINCGTADFCAPNSEVYVRRQLIAWADSAKIRWGRTREDSPYIWEYMEKYTALMAKYFDGFRFDNCHSTPIHVLENVVDRCRRINPHLILIGELFTDSEHEDNWFVNRTGITYLIRERMSASDLRELCHIVHRFGGDAIGSFTTDKEIPVTHSKIPRAILMDMTHDNPSVYHKCSPLEYCPTMAFVTMAVCSIGSVRGFDEMVPYNISVVDETRKYLSWEKESTDDTMIKTSLEKMKYLNNVGKTFKYQGVIDLRIFLNQLHLELESQGYTQIYIDQINSAIVSVTRYNPEKTISFVLISHHAFKHPEDSFTKATSSDAYPPQPFSTDWKFPAILIPGVVEEVFLEAYMYKVGDDKIMSNGTYICGSDSYMVHIRRKIQLSDSKVVELDNVDDDLAEMKSQIGLSNFPPGSIIILKVCLHEKLLSTIQEIRSNISNIKCNLKLISEKKESHFDICLRDITFSNINDILFKCKQEELDDAVFPIFSVPNSQDFIYEGLYGLELMLAKIRRTNDLGHPLCNNIRQGHWLIDHILSRVKIVSKSAEFVKLLSSLLVACKCLPKFLIPCYFDASIRIVIELIINYAFSKMDMKFLENDHFSRKLSISTFALIGSLRNIKPPKVVHKVNKILPSFVDPEITISAGLPHFSCGWSRVWGRDVFLSLPGLLIIPGRVAEAKFTILSIASTLRHGMIPNLISSLGASPRYNARDATWYFLYSIKQFIYLTDDHSILTEKVYRIFNTDDSEADLVGERNVMTLIEIIQEIMQRHHQGIEYTERDAGPKIDSCMKTDGFRVTCGVDPNTGFLYGGNQWNCGTWMDKMGSSDKAKNKGYPATPRDGSCIEIVGLFSAILTWLTDMHKKGVYPYAGIIKRPKEVIIKWEDMNKKIHDNFESSFWIPEQMDTAKLKFASDSSMIHKVGIYKDTVNSSYKYSDYQLRPNFLVAMVVAPSLFVPSHAAHALTVVSTELEGPYGMATLDHHDWNYHGYYISGDDSSDFKIGNGFNYHQGPEWLWLTGYYIRALLNFSKQKPHTRHFDHIIRSKLSNLYTLEESNDWLGLPELTQKKGKFCNDSSRIQAWSIACTIEALHEFYAKNPRC